MSMRIVFFGNGERGVNCLEALRAAGHDIALAVGHPEENTSSRVFKTAVQKAGIPLIAPADPNASDCCDELKAINADLFVLAAYGKILKPVVIGIPSRFCLNLHGGKLPECRGSSPMNWALIRGASSFTLSIIEVDGGVDTGPVLLDRTFPVSTSDTIRELHHIAHTEFPTMLVEVVNKIEQNSFTPRIQQNDCSGYYPLRFPDDGFVLWDQSTALEIYNKIRALTEPYPCAFTYYKGQRIQLLAAELLDQPYYGEPGRIYQKTKSGFLVCASDRCIRITSAKFADSGNSVLEVIKRYESFSTVREAALAFYKSQGKS